jgi:cytidylate kinase
MNKAILITGKISSGKSTLSKYLIDKIPNAINLSFGGYLKNLCVKKGIDITNNRSILQNMGLSFIEENPKKFLREVIEYYSTSNREIHIFEGVRHMSIFNEIENSYIELYSIYLDVPPKTRYDWYNSREKQIDSKISYQKFIEKDNHQVEMEIEQLKGRCGLITSPAEKNHFKEVEKYLLLS